MRADVCPPCNQGKHGDCMGDEEHRCKCDDQSHDLSKKLEEEPPPRPEYPHSAWVRQVEAEFETRALTEPEALGYTEALMFERLSEESIPSLRKQLAESEPGSLDQRNAAVFLGVACKLASGLAADVTRIRQRFELVTQVIGRIKQ